MVTDVVAWGESETQRHVLPPPMLIIADFQKEKVVDTGTESPHTLKAASSMELDSPWQH
jgi:hypothetical protein